MATTITEVHVSQALHNAAASLRDAAQLIDQFAASLNTSTSSPYTNGGSLNFGNIQQFAAATASMLPQSTMFDAKLAAAAVGARAGAPVSAKPEKRKRGEGKIKKARDPNAPKRPPSAYLLFQNEVRKEMQARFPGKPYHEVLTEISKRWSGMSEEEKSKYNQATAVAKEKYTSTKAVYDRALADGSYIVGGEFPTAPDPVVAVAEEESDDDSDSDSDDSDDSDDEPTHKKAKAAPVAAAASPPAAKEKKHKHAAA